MMPPKLRVSPASMSLKVTVLRSVVVAEPGVVMTTGPMRTALKSRMSVPLPPSIVSLPASA